MPEITGEDGKAVPASDQEEAAGEAIDKAWELCAGLEKKLSRTQDASEISRLNHAGGEWTEVSSETAELISEGIKYSELSGGEFDITIGGVTDLWDFHADPEDAKVPDAEKLAEAIHLNDVWDLDIKKTLHYLNNKKITGNSTLKISYANNF